MFEDERLMERFAENLKRARRSARMSQEELRMHSSVHQTQISAFERANKLPSLQTLLKLCAALRCTPNDLLDGIRWEQPLSPQGDYRIDWGTAAKR